MKRLFTFLFTLVVTASLWAEDFSVGGIYYNYLDGNNVEVTYRGDVYDSYYNEYAGEVIIPSTVTYNGTTYNVTSIGEWAFAYCDSLTSITIPNSVTSIVWFAFRGCSSLTSVTIPESVTSIGNSAFYECRSLTSITIPNSVTSIGYGAFSGCFTITTMFVEDGNTTYDSRDNCNAIIETATNTLIAGCQNTIIPNSVTSIGESAFYECRSLTSITIPNSVTSIGVRAFEYCSSLTSITIPNSITSIEGGTFRGCSSFTSLTIPNSVTSIGIEAFRDCVNLTSITLGNSVTSIGEWAFYWCYSLTSITIPNSVTSIGDDAFYECRSLTSMFVEDGNTTYDSRDNCNAIIETATNTLIAGCQNTIIPNSVTSIGDQAFQHCSGLTSITIPNSVKSIGKYAFRSCSSLTSVTIPNSVTSIGNYAFWNCSSLTSVTIGNSVTSIGNCAFRWCSSLDTVTCLAMTPPALLGEDVFDGCDNPTLYVPCEALPDYQAHEEWGQFTTIECIASEEAETEEVVIESGTTTVVIIWPTEEGADTYTIVIKKDGEVVCTLTFNSEGQLINIAFAPGRNGNHPAQYAEAVASGGFRFTVTGLEEGTDYTYDITVKDASNQTIHSHTGAFTTQSTTAVDNITTTTANIQKIMRDGQLIILRDGVEYNAIGQEL